jgi:hypothetical protein
VDNRSDLLMQGHDPQLGYLGSSLASAQVHRLRPLKLEEICNTGYIAPINQSRRRFHLLQSDRKNFISASNRSRPVEPAAFLAGTARSRFRDRRLSICISRKQLRVRLQEFHHFGGFGGKYTGCGEEPESPFSTARSASSAQRIAGGLNDSAPPAGGTDALHAQPQGGSVASSALI